MRYIHIIFFILAGFRLPAQINIINQSLTDSTVNILYIGIENKIKITGAKSLANTSLRVSGEASGTIDKMMENEYIIGVTVPTEVYEMILVSGTKRIFRKKFIVKHLEDDPIATISGLKDTIIAKERILLNPYPIVIMPGSYYLHKFSITSFNATFIKDNDSTVTFTTGNKLSTEQLNYIKELEAGDFIYFDGIKAICPYCRTRILRSFWLKIK